MKKSLLITAALFCGTWAFAQQEFQPSQYLQNPYIINPAAAGLTDYVDINLGVRNQWTGFDGAPQTYYVTGTSLLGKGGMGSNKMFALRISDPYISLEGNEKTLDQSGKRKLRHALGASLMVDQAGAFRKNIGGLSYAVHIPLSSKLNLSAGVKATLNNFVFDQNRATFLNSDATVTNYINSNTSTNFLDANFGLMLYGDKLFVGYSNENLFQSQIKFGDITTNSNEVMHHFITAGYRFELSENVGLTPATLIKLTKGAPASADITAKVDFQRKLWFGATVRPQDAVVGFLGARIGNFINVGYSYDFTTSELSNVSNGTHEFVINFMLGK
ncbi:MAG TPA: type IX secretion system membrane protein PorP/SprF [Luteibaculaceae bacterium]|nr:type IX secretion system membrane protein PorP/SprF [Luteibaculaceae bacterium]